MKHITVRRAVRLAGFLGVLLAISCAQARQVKAEDKPRQRAGSVKFAPGTQESEAERSRRLQRECRGRPNAGACLGHAS